MTDVTGTSGDDFLFFSGLSEELDMTLVNAYSGETIFISSIYNVNTATYNGLAGNDTLLMTNMGDALFILNDANQQTLFSIERIVAGDGGDVINLSSTTVTLGNTFIDGGPGDDILWGNSGNDTIQGAGGNDNIDGGLGNDSLLGQDGDDNVKGGAGNDTVSGGNGNDVLDGNAGNDTVTGDAGNDTLVYTQSDNAGATDNYNGGADSDTLVLRLTAAQANADAADIAAAQAFIASHLDTTSSTGPSYTFSSFGLTISNIESITVVITSNNNPVARDDDFTGTRDQVVAGNVLVNNGHGADSDADGDALSVQATTLTTAAGGHVVLNSNGTFTYTEAAGFTGVDTFNYTLLDTHGGSATGTVHLTINPPPNQNPVAHEDDFLGQENNAVTGNLLADNGHGAASDPDGDIVTAVAGTFTSAHGGSIVVNVNGTFTYTPASNFFGNDSVNYTISDGHGGTATATAFFAINGTPTAGSLAFSGQENQVVSGNLLGAATDPDGGTLTATAGTFATGHGSVTVAGDGSFVYTPNAGYFGADSFNWTVQDGQGGSATGSVAISLNAPPAVASENFSGQENQTVSGNLMGGASDPDGGTLTATAGTFATAHGSVIVAGDGSFVYTPNAGYFGADSFNWAVQDGQGGSATGAVSISLNAPPAVASESFSGQENQSVSGNLMAGASDPDGGTLTATAGTFATAHGSVTVAGDGSFVYTPNAGYFGADSFNWAVQDGQGGSATGSVAISLNAPPVAQEDDFTGTRNAAISGNVLADNGHGADSDVDGGMLSVTAAVIATAAGGTVNLSADGTFTYTPAANYTGADSFTYNLLDGQGGNAAGSVNLTINPPANQPPVAQDDVFSTAQGHSISGDVLLDNGHGVDSDPDGDALSVQAAIITTAGGGQIDLHADGTFTYTPAAGYTGADSFTYSLLDGKGGEDSGNVTLSVGAITTHAHEFSDSNVLFPAVIEGTNIAYLVPPGTPALGVLHGELDIGNATTATVTFEQSVAGYHNSLGAFVIAADGTIEDVQVLFKDAHQQSAGDQFNISLPANQSAQLGFFIIADGGSDNPSLNGMIHSVGAFHFYYDYGQADQRVANVSDDGTHVSLVYTNNGGHDTVLQGPDYFTTERGGSMLLNPDDATHVVSGLASADDTSQLRFSFEDLPNTGDADYNDLIFSVSMNSTTQTTTDANGDTALIGSAGLYGAAAENFLVDAVSPSPEKIVDFKGGAGGDTLDITNILHGFDSLSSLFANFVQATTSGGNTTIAVNSDGHTGGTFIPIAVLEGVHMTLADLVSDGNIIAAHGA